MLGTTPTRGRGRGCELWPIPRRACHTADRENQLLTDSARLNLKRLHMYRRGRVLWDSISMKFRNPAEVIGGYGSEKGVPVWGGS